MNSKRQIIRAKDIQELFGKGKSMSHKIMKEIRKHYQVQKLPTGRNGLVTIDMFSEYYGISKSIITATIERIDAESKLNRKNKKMHSTG